MPIVERMDASRPYLTSSPTNGINSRDLGWVATNPNPHSGMYGDTHRYDYSGDCMDWTEINPTRY